MHNLTQVPGAARRVGEEPGKSPPSLIARGARHCPKGKTCLDVSIIFEMCQKSLKVIKHILNYIRILYDFWHIDMLS